MRKLALVLLASAALFACVLPAFAGQVNEIVLSGSGTSKPVSFHGTGSGHFNVVFNINNLGAFGDPSGVFAGVAGYYSILNGGATVSSMSPGACGTSGCVFVLTQSAPVAFTLGSSPGGNDLLTGSLELVDIVQTGSAGVFNDALVINLTVTGGSLQGLFAGNNGSVQLTIKFSSGQNLVNIAKNQAFLAEVISGAVFPVPEPGSLTLLGAGLLGFAGLCRKKFAGTKRSSTDASA